MKIFYDVDTQKDFMDENGALYVPGAEDLKPNLAKLTDYALRNNFSVYGSVDRHFDCDAELAKNNGLFPDHCMDGTEGEKRISETNNLRPHFITNKIDAISGVYAYSLEEVATIKCSSRDFFFEKQHNDVFTNPNAELFLQGVTEAFVYGVATEYCVKPAVLGMLERGIQVYLVEDAITGVTPEGEQEALEEMVKAGAQLTTTAEVVGEQ